MRFSYQRDEKVESRSGAQPKLEEHDVVSERGQHTITAVHGGDNEGAEDRDSHGDASDGVHLRDLIDEVDLEEGGKKRIININIVAVGRNSLGKSLS